MFYECRIHQTHTLSYNVCTICYQISYLFSIIRSDQSKFLMPNTSEHLWFLYWWEVIQQCLFPKNSWGIKLNQTCLMFSMWLFLAGGETVEYTNNSNLGKFWLLNDGEAWVDLEEALDLDHLKVIYFSKIQTSSNLNVAPRLWHWIETFCLRLVSLVDDVRSYIAKSALSPFKLRNWCGVSRMANILTNNQQSKKM